MAVTPRRRLPPEDRRQEILSSAAELIATAGYNAVSLDAFAEAAGLSKAGLLHHFGSKAELLIAVLSRRDLDAGANLLELDGPIADRATARAALDQVVAEGFAQRQLVQLYVVLAAEALDPEHPAHAFFRQRFDRGREHLSDRVFSWHPRPDFAATQTMSFLDGLQLSWLRDPALDFEESWRTFADHLFAE